MLRPIKPCDKIFNVVVHKIVIGRNVEKSHWNGRLKLVQATRKRFKIRGLKRRRCNSNLVIKVLKWNAYMSYSSQRTSLFHCSTCILFNSTA
mmetsp:Transcript_3770/g.8375  ORF Transcript_3770/g.8375 Transcript_3770/m.8375 type:complete len:92 (+) Transcript_3770:93-368(+)